MTAFYGGIYDCDGNGTRALIIAMAQEGETFNERGESIDTAAI